MMYRLNYLNWIHLGFTYVRVPENHIVIDFDIPDEKNKSLKRTLKKRVNGRRHTQSLVKEVAGIHLHYIYTGDVSN